ncbi:MAG: hypothetical protein Q4G03_10520 [Planctomycetia bacterium]|nr:hypothetical protein [Planctomycetia bacterium]
MASQINYYKKLELFLDPPNTTWSDLEAELKKKEIELKRQVSGAQGLKAQAQLDLLKQAMEELRDESVRKKQANIARNQTIQNLQSMIEATASNDTIAQEQVDRICKRFEKTLTQDTIYDEIRQIARIRSDNELEELTEPDNPYANVKYNATTYKKIDDNLQLLGFEGIYRALGVTVRADWSAVRDKAEALIEAARKKVKKDTITTINQELGGQIKSIFSSQQGKLEFDLNWQRYQFEKSLTDTFAFRIVGKEVSRDNYIRSLKEARETISKYSKLDRSFADWFVYNFFIITKQCPNPFQAQVAAKEPCYNCGKENPPNQNVCGHCGAKLIFECPKCGKSNAKTKFCANCGANIDELNAALDKLVTLRHALEANDLPEALARYHEIDAVWHEIWLRNKDAENLDNKLRILYANSQIVKFINALKNDQYEEAQSLTESLSFDEKLAPVVEKKQGELRARLQEARDASLKKKENEEEAGRLYEQLQAELARKRYISAQHLIERIVQLAPERGSYKKTRLNILQMIQNINSELAKLEQIDSLQEQQAKLLELRAQCPDHEQVQSKLLGVLAQRANKFITNRQYEEAAEALAIALEIAGKNKVALSRVVPVRTRLQNEYANSVYQQIQKLFDAGKAEEAYAMRTQLTFHGYQDTPEVQNLRRDVETRYNMEKGVGAVIEQARQLLQQDKPLQAQKVLAQTLLKFRDIKNERFVQTQQDAKTAVDQVRSKINDAFDLNNIGHSRVELNALKAQYPDFPEIDANLLELQFQLLQDTVADANLDQATRVYYELPQEARSDPRVLASLEKLCVMHADAVAEEVNALLEQNELEQAAERLEHIAFDAKETAQTRAKRLELSAILARKEKLQDVADNVVQCLSQRQIAEAQELIDAQQEELRNDSVLREVQARVNQALADAKSEIRQSAALPLDQRCVALEKFALNYGSAPELAELLAQELQGAFQQSLDASDLDNARRAYNVLAALKIDAKDSHVAALQRALQQAIDAEDVAKADALCAFVTAIGLSQSISEDTQERIDALKDALADRKRLQKIAGLVESNLGLGRISAAQRIVQDLDDKDRDDLVIITAQAKITDAIARAKQEIQAACELDSEERSDELDALAQRYASTPELREVLLNTQLELFQKALEEESLSDAINAYYALRALHEPEENFIELLNSLRELHARQVAADIKAEIAAGRLAPARAKLAQLSFDNVQTDVVVALRNEIHALLEREDYVKKLADDIQNLISQGLLFTAQYKLQSTTEMEAQTHPVIVRLLNSIQELVYKANDELNNVKSIRDVQEREDKLHALNLKYPDFKAIDEELLNGPLTALELCLDKNDIDGAVRALRLALVACPDHERLNTLAEQTRDRYAQRAYIEAQNAFDNDSLYTAHAQCDRLTIDGVETEMTQALRAEIQERFELESRLAEQLRLVAKERAAGRLNAAQAALFDAQAFAPDHPKVKAEQNTLRSLRDDAFTELKKACELTDVRERNRLLDELSRRFPDLPEIQAELHNTLPSEPINLYARMEGDRVVLTWNAPLSLAAVSHKYRVERVLYNDEGEPIDTTNLPLVDGTTFTDQNLTPYLVYAYRVVTVRDSLESTPALSNKIQRVVPLQDVEVHCDDGEAQVTWSALEHVVSISVVRRDANGVPVLLPEGSVHKDGFIDAGLTNDAVYSYEIAIHYRDVLGNLNTVAPVTIKVKPQIQLKRLENIRFNVIGNCLYATWDAPIKDKPFLLFTANSVTSDYQEMTVKDFIATYGMVCRHEYEGNPESGYKALTTPLPKDAFDFYVTPLTCAHGRCLIAPSIRYDNAFPPVRNVRVCYYDNSAYIEWEWDPRAESVLVLWSTTKQPTDVNQRNCSRRFVTKDDYQREGGLKFGGAFSPKYYVTIFQIYKVGNVNKASKPFQFCFGRQYVEYDLRSNISGVLKRKKDLKKELVLRSINLEGNQVDKGSIPAVVVIYNDKHVPLTREDGDEVVELPRVEQSCEVVDLNTAFDPRWCKKFKTGGYIRCFIANPQERLNYALLDPRNESLDCSKFF